MQNVPDFFHQARGFFCRASLVGLSCHSHYSSQVYWCHASDVKLASKIDHTDPRCCMCKVKTHSFSFRKDKIPVVTVVIMYDLLSGKCSTMKVHMFSMTSTLWPSFFVHICSFFPFSSVPNQKVRQAWAFNLLLYEDLGIEVRWGPWMKVKWGNPPSYLATQVISFCPNKIGKQIHDHLKDSQSPMESPSAKWFLLVCRSEGADLFPSHHGNLAKSRLAKKTLF